MSNPEIVITVGFPGAGKGTFVKPLIAQGYQQFNRDTEGGSTNKAGSLIYQKARDAFDQGCRHFVFDNTYGTKAIRQAVFVLAQELGLPVRCLWLQTPIEQAQVFAARRQVQQLGKLLRPNEYRDHRHNPNMFPPGAQYAYRASFEPPTLAEGFASIEQVTVKTVWGPEYVNKAIILDLDGTVRTTHTDVPWPRTPDEVHLLPGRKDRLRALQQDGYLLLGATNQSGVDRKPTDEKYVSEANVIACIQRTNDLLGLPTPIDVLYSTDRGGPPQSFWRKPCPGMAVALIEKYKIDPSQSIVVGDSTSDRTFAERCGFKFMWVNDFFC